MTETATDPNSVTTASGVIISSSEPITKEEREYLTKAKPIPPGSKPGNGDVGDLVKENVIEVESVDQSGKSHGKDGRFKGKEAKSDAEEKPDAAEAATEKDETSAEREAKKHDAQSRIRDLASKKNEAEARAARLERELKAEREAKAATAAPKADVSRETTKPEEKGRPRLKDYDDYEKWEADDSAWLERRAGEIADQAVARREEARAQQESETRRMTELQESVKASDKAIKDAGGEAFLEKVAPTMERIMPSFEAERLGLEITPLHALGDFVVHSKAQVADVMLYLHENPGVVDRFEEIGRLPASRQPLAIERELGMLYGALKERHKVKASAKTDDSEPGAASFKPRAAPPPPSVQGSPTIGERDLSKIEDFGEFMRAKGHVPRR